MAAINGNDPAAAAGPSSGAAAASAGASAILKAQTGEPPVSERSWADRASAAYRGGAGVCLYPFSDASGSRAFTSGQVFASYWAPDSEQRAALKTITNVEVGCNVAGSAVTLAQIALWDYATNALLAQTADFSGALAVAMLNRALQTPLPMPTKPFLVGLLVAFTTTTPQFAAKFATGGLAVSSTPPLAVTQVGPLGALPNPLVPAAHGSTIWFGLN